MKHIALCACGLILFHHYQAHAANITWGNVGKTFSTGSNWVGGVAPVNDLLTDTAIFAGTPASGFQPNLTANRSIFKMAFGSAGWDFTANVGVTLSLGTGGILSNVATAGSINTISAPLSIGAATTFEVAGSSTHALHLNGVVSGAGGITKTGIGVLVLNANNSYTGATTVNAGTLRLGDHLQISVNSDLVMGASGTFDLAGFQESVASISGSGSITLGAGGSLSFGWDDTSTTWSGAISGSSAATLYKYGTGKLTLNGTVDFGVSAGGGTLFINEGSVELGASNRISNNAAVSIATGSTLFMGGFTDFVGPLTGSGLVSLGNGTLISTYAGDATFSGDIAGPGTFEKRGAGVMTLGVGALIEGSLTGTSIIDGSIVGNHSTFGSNVSISSGASLRMEQEAAGTFAGSMSGSGDFIKNGAGSLSLSGTSTSFTGDIELNAGQLTLSSGSLLSASVDITTAAGTTLTMSNHARTVNTLSGDGAVNLGGSTLTLKSGSTFSGAISGTGSGITFDPANGSAVLTLSGANSYTGTTLVNSGTVRLAASTVLHNNSPLTVQAGAAFDLDGNSDAVGLISGGGSFLLGGGTLTTNVPTGTFSFSGTIQEAGDFNKSGTGTLVLNQAQQYTGNTVINAGILRLGIANALPASTALNVTANDTFDLNNFDQTINSLVGSSTSLVTLGSGDLTLGGGGGNYNTTYSGVIQGTGGLKVYGINGGTLTLAGANEYTGQTSVAGGPLFRTTLRMAGDYRLDSATHLQVGLTGNYDLNGYTQVVANLGGSGDIYLGSGGILGFGANGQNSSFTGFVSGSSGARIEKNGAGEMTWDIDHSGIFDTHVKGGTLFVLNGDSLPDAGKLFVTNDAEVRVSALEETIAGLQIDQAARLQLAAASHDPALILDNSDTSTVDGLIYGTGMLWKKGTGTLIFTRDPTSPTSFDYGLMSDYVSPASGYNRPFVENGVIQGTTLNLRGRNRSGDFAIDALGTVRYKQSYDGDIYNRYYGGSGTVEFGETNGGSIVYGMLGNWGSFSGTIRLLDQVIGIARTGEIGDFSYRDIVTSSATLDLASSGAVMKMTEETNLTLGRLIGTGHLQLLSDSRLLIGTSDFSSWFEGPLTGTGSVEKVGSGVFALSNSSNNLTGPITVQSGTLQSAGNHAINSQKLVLQSIATYDLNGHDELIETLEGSGTVLLGGGSLSLGGGVTSAQFIGGGSISKLFPTNMTFTGDMQGITSFDHEAGNVTFDAVDLQILNGFAVSGAMSGYAVTLKNGTTLDAGEVFAADGAQLDFLGSSSVETSLLRLATGNLRLEQGSIFDSDETYLESGHSLIVLRESSLNLGTISNFHQHTGTLEIDMQGGALSWGGDLSVGLGGWFGAQMIVSPGEKFTLTGNTTIAELGSLTLDGGIFSTGSMSRLGNLVLNSGIIEFTGSSGVTVGGSGPLANGIQVPYGVEMRVQGGSLNVAGSSTSFSLTGGTVKARTLSNEGVMDLGTGVFEVTNANQNLTNASNSGTLLVSNTAVVSGVMANSGRITLRNDSGYLRVSNVLDNTGLIHGAGRVRAAGGIQNVSGGEIRGENGKLLTLESAVRNIAKITLQGGTLEFAGGLENGLVGNTASSIISGRGTLITSGITNRASMAFSSGNTDIYGDVNNVAGGRIVTSGGAAGVTTFFDDVIHNGTEIRTSAGSSTVFFGSLSGSGPFTGPGTVYIEGDMRPGNSPGIMIFEGDLVLSPTSNLIFELGGDERGTEYDATDIAGEFIMAGILDVTLINSLELLPGVVFDLFDWGMKAGAFDEINLPELAEGLEWDMSDFDTNGSIAVASTRMTYARWKTGFVFGSGVNEEPDSDPDRDGRPNLLEYTLDTDPLLADLPHPASPQVVIVDVFGAKYLGLTYQRPSAQEDRRTDLLERVTRSTTPGGGWSTDNVMLHFMSDLGGVETLIYRSTVPLGSAGPEFLRFECAVQP